MTPFVALVPVWYEQVVVILKLKYPSPSRCIFYYIKFIDKGVYLHKAVLPVNTVSYKK